jgi:outer membrane protein TolC
MNAPPRAWCGASALALLSACASAPPSTGVLNGELEPRLGQRFAEPPAPDAAGGERTLRRLLASPLTADSAVRVALLNSPALQGAYAQLGVARADVIAAGLIANPVLTLERRSSTIGVERGVGIMQDLIGIVTLPARRQLAQQHYARAELDAVQRILGHCGEIRAAYYTLQADAQMLELAQTAASASSAAAELARRQQAAGNVSRLQASQHQSFHAETLLDVARAQSQLTLERETLNSLLGLWGSNTQWTLVPRLPPLPGALPRLAEVEAQAIARRLDLASARRELESTLAASAFERQTGWLSALGIGFSRTRETDDQTLRGASVEIGLPLFDRGQARVARLQSVSAAQQAQMKQLAIDIRAQARAARERLAAGYEQARYHESTLLPLHEQIVAETQLRYNGMLADVYELLQAKRNQLAVARSYVASLRDYWRAHVELERALGGRWEMSAAAAPAQRSPAQPMTPSVTPPPAQDRHEHHHRR